MSAPTPAGGRVGPFRVESVRGRTDAGEVLEARGPDGRAVELVLLAAGPASDPACRGRFADAVRSGGSAGRPVLAADVAAERPWAAVPPGVGASPLLAAVLPDGTAPSRGPRFVPYWQGEGWRPFAPPVTAPAAAVAAPGRDRTLLWSLLAVLAAVLLILLLLWLLLPPDGAGEGSGGPAPQPYPTRTLPLPAPPSPAPGEPSPGPDGRPSPGEPGGTPGVPGDVPGDGLLGPTPSLPG